MGAPQDLSLLSGGQKSLVIFSFICSFLSLVSSLVLFSKVALALIFAIQKADPAPFYLMDEVDAALDSTHRLAVAEMLKKQSEDSQYIVATFKPELVRVSDRFYKISYANKVSNIRSVNMDDALQVIQEQN